MRTKIKLLPYGSSNFGKIMTENYVYIDKTRFIELLENEANPNQFFIRPRKFGKSLFYSMLYPEDIIDKNLITDYVRIKRLVENDRNREKLLKIIKDNGIEADIIKQFSIDRMYDEQYFVSLLVYMGLLTIDKVEEGTLRLKIPNYSIRTLFRKYIKKLTDSTNEA
jgi:hypothetical protein